MRSMFRTTRALALALLLSAPLAACGGPPVIKTVDKAPPQRLLSPCLRPDDKPETASDRVLASWVAETWQRAHDCADKVEGWIEWSSAK